MRVVRTDDLTVEIWEYSGGIGLFWLSYITKLLTLEEYLTFGGENLLADIYKKVYI